MIVTRCPLKIVSSFLALALLLAGCASGPQPDLRPPTTTGTHAPKKATSRPYQIKGVWYYPQHHYEYEEVGIASYYGGGDVFHGRPTATGEIFDKNGVTAAHKTVPLPCIAEVTNLENGRKIVVKVNDRGPFVGDRIIDVSRRVAQLLGFERAGTAKVKVKVLVEDSLSLNSLEASKVVLDETVVDMPMTAPTATVAVASLAPLGAATAAVALAKTPQKVETLMETPPKAVPVVDVEVMDADLLPDVLPDDFFSSIEPQEVVALEMAPLTPEALPTPLEPVAETTSTSFTGGGGRGIYVDVGQYSVGEAEQIAETVKALAEGLTAELKKTGEMVAVRLGPLPSTRDADLLLDHLLESGYHQAKMILKH